MAAATTIIAGVGLALGAVGTFASIQQQKKAAKKQEKLADLQRRREERRLLRARFREQGRLENLGAAQTGQTGSLSGIQGGITSASSLAGGEIGFGQQSFRLQKGINRNLRKASFFQGLGEFAGGVASFAGGVIGQRTPSPGGGGGPVAGRGTGFSPMFPLNTGQVTGF